MADTDSFNPFDREHYSDTHPEVIVKGQFVGWKLDKSYDDVTYGMKYVLREVDATDPNVSVEIIGSRGTIGGNEYWIFELDSAESDAWAFTKDVDCRWDLLLTVNGGTNEAIISSGFVKVFLDTSTRRTHAETMLAKINSILEGRADSDVSSYSIKSRSISKMSPRELIEWREYYIGEIKRTGGSTTDNAGSSADSKTLRIRFV